MVDIEIEEENDCAIRALKIVSGLSYYEVHKSFSRFGREYGNSTSTSIIFKCFCYLPIKVKKVRPNAGTINNFLRLNPKGRYFLYTHNHALAIIDGEVQDSTLKNSHIHGAYKLL